LTREQVKMAREAEMPGSRLAGLLLGLVSKHSEATDPRDKIYGLLSLAGDVDTLPKPDYTKDVEAVFLEFAQAMYRTHRGLLMQAGLQQQSLSLPSWVPDWTFPAKQIDHIIGRRGEIFLGHSNMLFEPNDDTPNFRTGNSPTELVLPGFLADTIDMTGIQMLNSSMNLDVQWLLDFNDWDQVAVEILLAAETISGCTDPSQRLGLYTDFLASTVSSEVNFPEGGSRHLGPLSNVQYLDHGSNHVSSGEAALKAYNNMKENLAEWVSSQEFTMTYEESLYWGRVRKNIAGRAFAITENGHFALVPGITLVGDRVFIIPSFRNPFVMREDEEAYKLISDCYVKEYDRNPTSDDLQFEDIVLR
jgi:hypothetical protein